MGTRNNHLLRDRSEPIGRDWCVSDERIGVTEMTMRSGQFLLVRRPDTFAASPVNMDGLPFPGWSSVSLCAVCRSATTNVLVSCLNSSTSVPNSRSRYVLILPALGTFSNHPWSTDVGVWQSMSMFGPAAIEHALPRLLFRLLEKQCFCGLGLSTTLGHDGCTTPCKGNTGEICGELESCYSTRV